MKRYGKVFIMSLLSMFALTVPVFAREMTLQELGTKAKEQIPKTSYLYVIGEYAFTSEHTLTTQDVMLAARSIDAKDKNGKTQDDNIYKEMTIFQLKGEYDDLGDFTGNWKKGNNVVGTSQLGDNLNIRYIDYNYIKDLFTVTFDLNQGKFADNTTSITVEEGEKISKDLITGANAPIREGKKFKAWVKVENGQDGAAWNFDTDIVNSNITLKATWYDEVNTNELLKEAQSKIQKNEFYGISFENKVLTYHLYDKNKENSEIIDNGLIETIKEILNNENVKLLTVSYNNNSYDFDRTEMNDNESNVYTKLQELLAKAAGKSNFEEMVQGDLVGKELTLTVKLNENIVRSQDNNIEESYAIKFVYEEQATIGVQIPEKDKNELQSKFNYTPESTYQIEGKDGSYKVTGKVKEKEDITGFGEHPTGFYFAYTITLNEGIDLSSVKVKIPKGDNEEAGYNIATKDDFTENQLTVLMEVGENESVKYRDIIVEVDGVPTKIRINFSGLTFLHAHKVSFKGIKADALTVWDGDKVTEDMLPKDIEPSDAYHEFAYWNKEDGTKFSEITVTEDSEDIAVVAHWNLYSDKFVADVLEDLNSTENTSKSGNFSEEFIIEDYVKNSGKVTIAVLDPTTKLSRMNDTSIPGAIAYILLKDEIQEITLSVNGETKTFTKGNANDLETLKETVKNGAKELYAEILKTQFEGKNDDTVTLSDLAHKENYNSFTLKFNPEKVANTVTLVKSPMENEVLPTSTVEVPTDYTFRFEANVARINSEQTLKNAIAGAVKTIYIDGDFNVNEPIEINREVAINTETNKHTISANNIDSIFKVTNNAKVTIDNIKLKGTKKDIVVESGSLTTTGLEIITDGNTLPEGFEAAIEVKNGATLTAKDLTFEGETYEKPAVKAEKDNATVNLTNSQSETAQRVQKEKITKYEEQNPKENSFGDKKEIDSEYNYYNYYNKAENAKIYATNFYNYEGRKMAEFRRYNYYNENVTLPPNDTFKVFYELKYEGNIYTLIGFTEDRNKTVHRDYSDESSLPDGVVDKDGLLATSDKHYYAAYKVELPKDVSKITSAEQLKTALEDENIKEIYIDTTDTLDLSGIMDTITINRQLSITGRPQISKIKVKNIKVTADNVFMQRLNMTFTEPKDETLINVTENAQEFSLWQCSLTNGSETPAKYAVKYNNATKSIVDIRWTSFINNNHKITDSYIYVASALSAGSDIYYNTFPQLSSDNNKKSAITITKFGNDELFDEEDNIRIGSNTFNSNDYAIRILKDASNTKVKIALTTTPNIFLAVDYDENQNKFEGIELDTDQSKVTIDYINAQGTISKSPESGTAIQFISQIATGNSGISANNATGQIIIEGLKQNGNTYSGILNQSENGKFYLPVILTSNNFKNNVSTVKVTNPNGEESTYTYSSDNNNEIAVVSNTNTMKLQLEAIKSSKITGNNGKVYNITVDIDGKEKNEVKPETYTIDYSDVETLEEKINKAAQNTLEANSFTVTKNNKINGYTEKFTYQYNAKDGLTYLKSDNGDNVEEYTFSLKYVGIESSKLSVVARKKIESEEDSGVYLNDWVYVHPQKVGRAIHEVTMLTDVMKDSKTSINAIDTVELVEGKEHNYIVKLNGDKYTDWVKNNYRLTSKYTITEWGETVLVDVELDENDQYIKSIKTHQESSSNTFDVTFTNVDHTNIQEPREFLSTKEKQLTDEDIKNFYESGKKWWDKHIYENAYKQ